MRCRPWEQSKFWIEVAPAKVRLFCNPFEQLNGQRWHEVYLHGHWNVRQMLRDRADALIHSSARIARESGEPWAGGTLFFKISDEIFVLGQLDWSGHGAISCWAVTRDLACSECRAWRARYLRKPKRRKEAACFHVLSIGMESVEATPIPIVRRFPRTDADLTLHYGEDFPAWEKEFILSLKSHVSGASILQGESGTGKTTFIRHLIHKLKRTHKFYYLPANQLPLLSAPQLVQFWIRETRLAEKMVKIVVIEDAEPLLVTRARDNQDQLSNFLNISDGLPGEFLKLHLICTINCKIDKLDRAVVRTGRLLAYRNFRRLNRAEAARLALAKRLRIPVQENYSLAEIYNDQRSRFEEAEVRRVGFG